MFCGERKEQRTATTLRWNAVAAPSGTQQVPRASVADFFHKVAFAALQAIDKSIKRRWAVPKYTHIPFPLGQDHMSPHAPPDVFLLPNAAFEGEWSSETAKPDKRWMNWTSLHLVGACRTLAQKSEGQLRAVRFVEELRKLQPWQTFFLAVSYNQSADGGPLVSIIRADQSGLEKSELDLST